jgi:hypothetical protein
MAVQVGKAVYGRKLKAVRFKSTERLFEYVSRRCNYVSTTGGYVSKTPQLRFYDAASASD